MKCILDRDEHWPAFGLMVVDDNYRSGSGERFCEISEAFMERYEKAVKEFMEVNDILGEKWDAMAVTE